MGAGPGRVEWRRRRRWTDALSIAVVTIGAAERGARYPPPPPLSPAASLLPPPARRSRQLPPSERGSSTSPRPVRRSSQPAVRAGRRLRAARLRLSPQVTAQRAVGRRNGCNLEW